MANATDGVIWSESISRSAVLVTKDRDFSLLRAAKRQGPVVLWVRVGNIDNRALIRQLLDAMPQIAEAVARGEASLNSSVVSVASGIEPPFQFHWEDSSVNVAARASLPVNIPDKMSLLGLIAKQLSFPDHFGMNWDALEECMRDLSWLPLGNVILEHAEVPLMRDVASAKTYVAILADATRKTSKSDHPLHIRFPIGCIDQITWLSGSQR